MITPTLILPHQGGGKFLENWMPRSSAAGYFTLIVNIRITKKIIAIKEELSPLQIDTNKIDYLHRTGKCVSPAFIRLKMERAIKKTPVKNLGSFFSFSLTSFYFSSQRQHRLPVGPSDPGRPRTLLHRLHKGI